MLSLRRLFSAAALLLIPALSAAAQSTILHASEAARLLPPAVWFDGQTANTQARNSGGIRFADGACTLAVLVDTSGYTSAVQQKYQGYLLTDAPLAIAGHRLPAGAYGFGFVQGSVVVLDLGARTILEAPAAHDQQMSHPMPLQTLPGASADTFRLCSGRDCVILQRAR